MKVNTFKIYKYTSPSGKVYIGQTKYSLAHRAGGNLGSGYRHSTHFYAAIQKYQGLENFAVEILKDNLTLEEANYWETYYIAQYDSTNRKKGYNISLGGENNIMSPEGRARLSDRMKLNNPMRNPEIAAKVSEKTKGKKLSPEVCQHISDGHKKKVLCLETGIIYESRNAAAKSVGVSGSGIGRAINGEQKTSGGYHWRYYES